MHITTTREAILPALTLGAKASDTRSVVPILGCVLLSAEAGWMDLTTTDIETAAKSSIKCLIVEEGVAVLPIKGLAAFVKALPRGAAVSIKTAADGKTANLESGDRTASLDTMEVADFPGVAMGHLPVDFKMPAAELHRLFRKVRPAISTEVTRYYLNGIYLTAIETEAGDVLRAVATDGHKLMLADTPLPSPLDAKALRGKSETPWGIIVPTLAVSLIMDLIGKQPTGNVHIRCSDVRISVRQGPQIVVSKTIDGTFPEYDRVIPRSGTNILTTDATNCASVVTAAAKAVSKDKSQPAKFTLAEDDVNVSAYNADGARSASKLNGITRYAGDPMEIGFQSGYVGQILGVVDGPVHFAFSNNEAPVLITADNEPSWLAVLMPHKV